MSDSIPLQRPPGTPPPGWCCERAGDYIYRRGSLTPGGPSECAIAMVHIDNAPDDAGLVVIEFCPWCGKRLLK